MVGHIKIDRKILNWEWFTDVKTFHLFLYLLLKANHKNGNWRGNKVKRGQLITGRLKINADTGLSEREIRTAINKLKMTGEILVVATKQFSIITICKYDTYQTNSKETDQETTNETTHDRPTSDQRATNERPPSKNDNNDKKVIPILRDGDNLVKDQPLFKLQKIYDTPYEDYCKILGGKSKQLSEFVFDEWKRFVDFIWEKEYHDIFLAKFVNPIDFGKLLTEGRFYYDRWGDVLKSILASGINDSHNLTYRIPQFIGYYEKEKNNESKSTNSSIKSAGAVSISKIEALKQY